VIEPNSIRRAVEFMSIRCRNGVLAGACRTSPPTESFGSRLIREWDLRSLRIRKGTRYPRGWWQSEREVTCRAGPTSLPKNVGSRYPGSGHGETGPTTLTTLAAHPVRVVSLDRVANSLRQAHPPDPAD
jgi:hypothetical protein